MSRMMVRLLLVSDELYRPTFAMVQALFASPASYKSLSIRKVHNLHTL